MIIPFLIFELFIFYWVATNFSIYTWGSIVFVYACVYFWLDDGERTGYRSWNRGRGIWLWKLLLPVKFFYSNQDKLQNHVGPILYLVTDTVSHLPLVYAFGLLPPTTLCSFMLPRQLFYVPLLRDILLCCGAVAEGPESIIVLHRRSLAMAVDSEPPLVLFELCRMQKIHIVPVTVTGESERYYPNSLFQFPRIFGRVRPAQIHINIGALMNPSVFETAESFQELFVTHIKAIKNCI